MAVNRGVTFFVLLLYCCHKAELKPINTTSGPVTEKLFKSKIQKDMPEVFAGPESGQGFLKVEAGIARAAAQDEILVQEFLDPNKSTLFETQRPQEESMKSTTDKTCNKMNDQTDIEESDEKKPSFEDEDSIFSNGEEKEITYQIKSLTSLEDIIDSLRRALVNTLKQRRKKNKSLFKGAKHQSVKESLNQETKTA